MRMTLSTPGSSEKAWSGLPVERQRIVDLAIRHFVDSDRSGVQALGIQPHQRRVPDLEAVSRRHGADVDDADAVGEMIDDPHLRVGARGDRHRLESHRH
jgi:hypothetical protein